MCCRCRLSQAKILEVHRGGTWLHKVITLPELCSVSCTLLACVYPELDLRQYLALVTSLFAQPTRYLICQLLNSST